LGAGEGALRAIRCLVEKPGSDLFDTPAAYERNGPPGEGRCDPVRGSGESGAGNLVDIAGYAGTQTHALARKEIEGFAESLRTPEMVLQPAAPAHRNIEVRKQRAEETEIADGD